MGYVRPDKPDVFVSYAHIDDEPFPGRTRGWVTTLVIHLESLIRRSLRGGESFHLWIDHALEGNLQMNESILGRLRDCSIILIFLSPRYLDSPWTNAELTTFLDAIEWEVRPKGQVFLIEVSSVGQDRPAQFQGLPGYRFWREDRIGRKVETAGLLQRDPKDDPLYCKRMLELSSDLVAQLRLLKEGIDRPSTGDREPINGGPRGTLPAIAGLDGIPEDLAAHGPRADDPEPTVFLAEASDDLKAKRDDLRGYLKAEGLRVVPDGFLPRDERAFVEAVEEGLARARAFVQLLGPETTEGQRAEAERARNREIEEAVRRKRASHSYDVLLCHRDEDRDAVVAIADRLRAAGLLPWMGGWELPPGEEVPGLDHLIERANAAVVFVGDGGPGPWEGRDVGPIVRRLREARKRVFPAILAGAVGAPGVPGLENIAGVDFRQDRDRAMMRLISGIAGGPEGRKAALDVAATGSRPPTPDLPERFVALQLEIAERMGVEVLQWRHPDLKVDAVADPARLALLRGKDVIAEGLETFKQMVIKRARGPVPGPRTDRVNGRPKPDPDQLIFINADSPDRGLAEDVRARLNREDLNCVLPAWGSPPPRFREDQQRCWASCTDLLLVFAGRDPTWARSILTTERRRVKALRRDPIRLTAVWDAPPPDKPGLGISLPGVPVFDFRRGFDEGEFRRLISALKSGGPA